MADSIALNSLIFDEAIYPRQNVDDHHIGEMIKAMEGGITLPPILVERKTRRIVDGIHRYHAHLRRGLKKIACITKAYASDAELFKEAVMLNSGIGLKLGVADSLKVIEIGQKLGLKEIELAAALRTSIAHLRSIKPRYATLEETQKGVKKLRRVPLKGSVRHLSGEQITKDQEAAIGRGPGSSYLLLVRQLIDALEHDLLPPKSKHPTLWEGLAYLRGLLNELDKNLAA